jgi:hypothetical protein
MSGSSLLVAANALLLKRAAIQGLKWRLGITEQ